MHIPDNDLERSILTIKSLLKNRGKILLSIPHTRPGVGSDMRDETGRLYNKISGDQLTTLFNNNFFRLVRKWESQDDMGRVGYQWETLLFEKN